MSRFASLAIAFALSFGSAAAFAAPYSVRVTNRTSEPVCVSYTWLHPTTDGIGQWQFFTRSWTCYVPGQSQTMTFDDSLSMAVRRAGRDYVATMTTPPVGATIESWFVQPTQNAVFDLRSHPNDHFELRRLEIGDVFYPIVGNAGHAYGWDALETMMAGHGLRTWKAVLFEAKSGAFDIR